MCCRISLRNLNVQLYTIVIRQISENCRVLDHMSVPINLQYYSTCSKYPPVRFASCTPLRQWRVVVKLVMLCLRLGRYSTHYALAIAKRVAGTVAIYCADMMSNDRHSVSEKTIKLKNIQGRRLTFTVGYSTRKPSCRWQTRATLAKSLHGLRKSSGVVSYIASLLIDSLPTVSYYRPIVTLSLKCTVFEIWQHWLKIVEKTQAPSFGAILGVTPCEFFDDSYCNGQVGMWRPILWTSK